MARPQSILGDVKGMARDFSVDSLPKGYVWDLVDYLPSQRGAQLEGRAPWTYLTSLPLGGPIWGGYNAVFDAGEKLLVAVGSPESSLWDQPRVTSPSGSQPATKIGPLFGSIPHNGKFFYDKVYFADAQGSAVPKYVSYTGTPPVLSIASLNVANVPKAKLLDVWKGRLIAAGDPAQPEYVRWAPSFDPQKSPLGPLSDWDVGAYLGMDRAITALGPMANVCIVFHDGMTSRITGGRIVPASGLSIRDGVDTNKDTFSDQYGCVDPRSVVPWQENLIFANSHGVMLTDGSTIRSLTDQGGIGEVWRHLYGLKRSGTQVSCGIYLNKLFCSILTQWDGVTREDQPFTFVCDLTTRTWYRLTNILATCFIPSTTGAEQLWFGFDYVNQNAAYANRLARVSTMYTGLLDIDPDPTAPIPASFLPAVDPNGVPILPRITTGWVALGAAGQRRMRSVYVSHATQAQTQPPVPTGNVLAVGYRLTPVLLDSFVPIGGLPFSTIYDRKRLPVGRPAYGIQVHVEQTQASHISRLYDIQVDNWPVDRGRVS
jgi:hypothetical protein